MAGPVDNFYAPPTVDTQPVYAPTATIHRLGNVVVAPREGAILPARCVRCNEPASHRLMRQLYWHHPALYLLILVSLCVYVIPAVIFRKKAVLEVGLCDRHFKRRRWGIAVGWLGFLVGLVVFTTSIESHPLVALLFMLGMFVAPIVGIVMARVVTAQKIDSERVLLKVGRPFLESFQEVGPGYIPPGAG